MKSIIIISWNGVYVGQFFHVANISYKFPLLGKSMSTHKDNDTTKHQFNDTNTFAQENPKSWAIEKALVCNKQEMPKLTSIDFLQESTYIYCKKSQNRHQNKSMTLHSRYT